MTRESAPSGAPQVLACQRDQTQFSATSSAIGDMRIGDLNTDQLAHILANRRAMENAEPPPPMEWERREKTVQERVYAFAQWVRSVGIEDEAAIGCDLFGKLLRFGHSDEDARETLRDVGITNTRHSAEERLVRVATGMLSDGWNEEQVRWAIDRIVSNGR